LTRIGTDQAGGQSVAPEGNLMRVPNVEIRKAGNGRILRSAFRFPAFLHSMMHGVSHP
jgi:hypothetical protein